MRYWGYSAPPDELAKVTAAFDAFRTRWASIQPPFPASFDGSSTDIRALDYMQYEGIGGSECGIENAALVCGEVVRKAAGFEWVISYRGDWMVATHEHKSPSAAWCPLARLHEAECGGGPQFGKHGWIVEQATLQILLVADEKALPRLKELLENTTEYRRWLDRARGALGE